MCAFSFRRLRAVLLLAAFGLGLATQAFAAGAVTGPATPAAPAKMMAQDASSVMHCTACDQTGRTGTMPNCPAALCWGVVAAPAHVVRVGFVQAAVFAPPPGAAPHGLAVGPEPHPPRFPTTV